MKRFACCTLEAGVSRRRSNSAADGASLPSPPLRSLLKTTRWSLPTIILVLLPKCPVCLAAYVALGTGVSLSVATASLFRVFVVSLCVAMLMWALINTYRKLPINRLFPGNRI
jgi:hypothetical protein